MSKSERSRPSLLSSVSAERHILNPEKRWRSAEPLLLKHSIQFSIFGLPSDFGLQTSDFPHVPR